MFFRHVSVLTASSNPKPMSSTQDSLTDFWRMACDQAGIYNRKTRASTHNVGVYDVPSPLLLGLESLLAQCLSVPPPFAGLVPSPGSVFADDDQLSILGILTISMQIGCRGQNVYYIISNFYSFSECIDDGIDPTYE